MTDGLRASTGYLLARLGSESRRRWARMLAVHGLTPHHFAAIMVLQQTGSVHQQRLADLIGVDTRNAVPVLDLLVERGLIAREPDPTNRRRHELSLTPAGATALAGLRREADDVEADMLAGLAERDRVTLHRLLGRLFDQTVTG
jgi:DNA-binding MarR family transcriptional regulator